MKLPNDDKASVPQAKITEYLLSLTHEDGRSKAQFFIRFGFSAAKWQMLAITLQKHAQQHSVTRVENSPFGKRYIIEGVINAPDGRTPFIRTIWFIENTPFGNSLSFTEADMIKELDRIILDIDLPEYDLEKGDIGTIVLVHEKEEGFEVEFVSLDGETVAVVWQFAYQVRPISQREIDHARSLAAA